MSNGKKVTFGARPAAQHDPPPTAEDWVAQRHTVQVEGTKRLTLDIPASLHTRIKTRTAERGEKMVESIREILEREFPA